MGNDKSDNDANVLLARIDEKLTKVVTEVGELHHILLTGNGQPAIVSQIAVITEKVENLEQTNENKSIPRHAWLGALISLVAVAVSIIALLV